MTTREDQIQLVTHCGCGVTFNTRDGARVCDDDAISTVLIKSLGHVDETGHAMSIAGEIRPAKKEVNDGSRDS